MLEAIGLTKRYNGETALDALDLRVEPGEIFCLLGANGAGKTTTINLFLGFIAPTSGRVVINGLDIAAAPLETKRFVAGLGSLTEEDYERLPQFTWREENLDESMRRNLLTIAFLLTPAALLALLAAFYVRRYHPILA